MSLDYAQGLVIELVEMLARDRARIHAELGVRVGESEVLRHVPAVLARLEGIGG